MAKELQLLKRIKREILAVPDLLDNRFQPLDDICDKWLCFQPLTILPTEFRIYLVFTVH